MRKTTLAGFALLFGFAGVAAADCLSPSITAAGQIRGVIAGNTVCANLGSERWQEYHSGGGSYTFCGARNIDATFRPGQGAC